MKVLPIGIVACIVLSCAASTGGSVTKGDFLSGVVKALLDSLRGQMENIVIPPLPLNIQQQDINVTGNFNDGMVKNLDKFKISKLTTTLLPLRVTNLTLTFDDIQVTGKYDLNGMIDSSFLMSPAEIYGNGSVSAIIKDVLLTFAVNFKMVGLKLQIPENGIHSFDIAVGSSEINLENIMDGGEKGEIINKFLSFLFPDLVQDYKHDIFEMVKDPLIDLINNVLAAKSSHSLDYDPLVVPILTD